MHILGVVKLQRPFFCCINWYKRNISGFRIYFFNNCIENKTFCDFLKRAASRQEIVTEQTLLSRAFWSMVCTLSALAVWYSQAISKVILVLPSFESSSQNQSRSFHSRHSLSAVIIYLRITRCKLSNTNVPVLFASYILHSLFWQPLRYLAFLPLWRRDSRLPGEEGRSPPIHSSTIRWFRFSHELYLELFLLTDFLFY